MSQETQLQDEATDDPSPMEQLVEAVRQLRAASMSRSLHEVPELDVRVLMEQVRSEVTARRAGLRPAIAGQVPDGAFERPRFPRVTPEADTLPFRDEYSLRELLALSDLDFVRNAYRAILQRDADAAGAWFHLNSMYLGHSSKLDLLAQLHGSPEGRAAGVKIRGLRLALAMSRLRGTRVLGPFVAIVQYIAALPRLARALEQHETQLFRLRREAFGGIDALAAAGEGSLGTLGHDVAQSLEQRERAAVVTSAVLNDRIAMLASEVARFGAAMTRSAPHAEVLRLAESTLDATSRLARDIDALREVKADSADVTRGLEKQRAYLQVVAEDLVGIKAEEAALRRTTEELASRAQSVAVELAAKIDVLRDGLATSKAEEAALRRTTEELASRAQSVAAELVAKIDLLRGSLTKRSLEATLRGTDHELDAFYLAFENHFRGSREDIQSRVGVYLPIMRQAGAGIPEAPVADLGCGRGEWLQVLRDSGLAARGVDLNRAAVGLCRELGLDVVEQDVIEYLRGLPDNSLGAITGIQFIEHLPFELLVELFDQALRTLRPGGVAIFETPNPENLLVGAFTFWYDPTHVHPLPPEGMRFLAQARGFAAVEIVRLHPLPAAMHIADGGPDIQGKLNPLLYGEQDYSVVARKPGAAAAPKK